MPRGQNANGQSGTGQSATSMSYLRVLFRYFYARVCYVLLSVLCSSVFFYGQWPELMN